MFQGKACVWCAMMAAGEVKKMKSKLGFWGAVAGTSPGELEVLTSLYYIVPSHASTQGKEFKYIGPLWGTDWGDEVTMNGSFRLESPGETTLPPLRPSDPLFATMTSGASLVYFP